jgi:hypothetical protein
MEERGFEGIKQAGAGGEIFASRLIAFSHIDF